MPITGDLDGENTRGLLARVNFLRDEPGGRRFFVNDLNGPLYILDKQTQAVHDLSRFQRARRAAGSVPEVHLRAQLRDRPHQRHLRSRLRAQRRLLHDPHGGSDHRGAGRTEGGRRARPRSVGLQDDAGDRRRRSSPAAKITREAVMIEWTDRNIANATFEGTARELLRVQLTSPIHPLGEMTFNPAARRGDPDWRVMYVGSGDSGSGEQQRHPPDEPAAARQSRRQDPAHRPRPARAHRDEHGQRERALPHPERQSRSSPSTARARRSGRWACAIRID